MTGRIRMLSLALAVCGTTSMAAQNVNVTFTYQVNAINVVSLTGAPSLVINAATAGSEPLSATANATWAVTTNQSNAKITAGLSANMPASVTLQVNVTAPAGATSTGIQSLSTVAADVVTGITQLVGSGMSLTYTLSATVAAGVVASASRTVTFTITGGV